MKVSDFDYRLPPELIAQHPIEDRADSRLLIYDMDRDTIAHRRFRDILGYITKGDCLVLNDTRVIPARLIGHREDTGGKMEFLLLEKVQPDIWQVMAKPGRRADIGRRFVFSNGLLIGEVLEIIEDGTRLIQFEYNGVFEEVLDRIGMMPLPPYIHEPLADRDRYQTVYAKYDGSAAAPTAGLHFTPKLLNSLKEKGVEVVNITLHVGLGTFRPVKVEDVEDHKMHSEYYNVSKKSAEKINRAKASGGRIIAVGTTACRTLETVSDEYGIVNAGYGSTDIFIYPGYRFKVVDGLITNFHLPESTLLMLVSAIIGRKKMLEIYAEAVEKRYRFFSFGDAMFINSSLGKDADNEF